MEEIIKEIAEANKIVDKNNKENRILYGKIYELNSQLKRLEMNATYGKEIIDQNFVLNGYLYVSKCFILPF